MGTELLIFYAFAAIAMAASLAVVLGKNPMHSVLLLIVSFAALAGLYIGLDAPFAAVVQIIIYAGALMVLFLFVIMMLELAPDNPQVGPGWKRWRGRGGVPDLAMVANDGIIACTHVVLGQGEVA